jgi:hypothetical protein
MHQRTNDVSQPEQTPSSVTADRLRRAMLLALELESALLPVEGTEGEKINFRLRLARAQALGVVDILVELVWKVERPRTAVARSGVYPAPVTAGVPRPDEASSIEPNVNRDVEEAGAGDNQPLSA